MERRTIVEDPAEIQSLRVTANDPSASRDQRAQAIFSLFSRYVPVKAPTLEIHRLIPKSRWLDDSHLGVMSILAGWMPVDWPMGDTVAYIDLFPEPGEPSGRRWTIYLHLAGTVSEGDISRLLRGESTPPYSSLVEFALCFPESSNRKMRIETYTIEGRQVMVM